MFYETSTMTITKSEVEPAPWERSEVGEMQGEADVLRDGGKPAQVFASLLARLEKRARNWATGKGMDTVDPLLGEKTSIGVQLPIVNVGWAVSRRGSMVSHA